MSVSSSQLFINNLNQNIEKDHSELIQKSWHQGIHRYIEQAEQWVERKLPNFAFQERLDNLGRAIEKKFAPLEKFNHWLEASGNGTWYQDLALFLVKLPLRVAKTIIRLLYTIVKSALYAAVHPIKAVTRLAKLLVSLAHQLTMPSMWAKIGIGIVGASVGQALISGNPFSVIAICIGASMTLGGITMEALLSALRAEKGVRLQAAWQSLQQLAKELPEAALTGFCMGLLLGGIEKAIQPQAAPQAPEKIADTQQWAKWEKLADESNKLVETLTGEAHKKAMESMIRNMKG